MNSSDARLFELALKKQRIQFASEQLRARFAYNTLIVPPLCDGVDQVRLGWRWLRQRPAIPVAIGVALVVSRPRGVWRWTRRAFGAWQTWRRARALLESALNATRPVPR
jgi:hypothetical protein